MIMPIFKIWKLDYDGCKLQQLTNIDGLHISQNECTAHSYQANHPDWDTG